MPDDSQSPPKAPPAPAALPADLPGRKALPPFAALRAFDAVARLGGVRKAADVLELDHAVISRHLKTLESWTGTALIERSRTGALLTEEGARYHKRIAAAMDGIAGATLDLMRQGDNSRLLTWCMPGFALHWLMERLGQFEAANPDLDIELRPADTGPDFSKHEADVDIRFSPIYAVQPALPPTLRAVEVASPPTIPLASPDYLAAAPPVTCCRDLLNHQLLHEESFDVWACWLSGHGVIHQGDLSGPRLWHAHLTLDGARRGRGIALGNHLIAADDLMAGRLVEVGVGLPDFTLMPLGTYQFVARADRWRAPPIARFRQWLLDAVAREMPAALGAGGRR